METHHPRTPASPRPLVEGRLIADHAVEGGTVHLALLEKVDGEPGDLIIFEFEFPDDELAEDIVEASAMAGKPHAMGGAAEIIALGFEVLADFEKLSPRRAEASRPA